MMSSLSQSSPLSSCRSSPSIIPVQPDHFYGSQHVQLPPSPDSDGKTWLDPEDDPLAHRGIPVFKPTMDEFKDFEGYLNKIECWGNKSGIVKVIPPKEWTDSLPDLKDQLSNVKIKTPIEQHMLGRGGLFRQENMEKRKLMSVREWVELCTKDEFRAPGVYEVGLASRGTGLNFNSKITRKGKQKAATVIAESAGPGSVMIKEEPVDDYHSLSLGNSTVATPPNSDSSHPSPVAPAESSTKKGKKKKPVKQEKPKPRAKRVTQTREVREANLADRAARDATFLESFDPHDEWLPPNTSPEDYTQEFCQKLERQYWRNCGLGKPAWYGADTQGSLFTDATKAWNVAHLPSALSRLLPSGQGLPGVNTPYLYFGMWRATFAWHVEDMDLFSINYIHFGAPKFWYSVPQGRANALEQIMRGYFPKDTSQCPQFLRHKSFLASPSLLANSACRPNHLVQQTGEFVITFPRGYHAGFNLGLNCAESVNFALESWLDLGRQAKVCECISDSVRIDVDALLREREQEKAEKVERMKPAAAVKAATQSPGKGIVKMEVEEGVLPPLRVPPRKRKFEMTDEAPKAKKIKIKASSSSTPKTAVSAAPPKVATHKVTLKLGPRPVEPEGFPCCLCVSQNREGLLKVHQPPLFRKDAVDAASNPKVWLAHEFCASIVPETWVDEIDTRNGGKEKVVCGVDGIVKDRWNLKCSACSKNRARAHGAPVQCTKGKCPKAFHVNCAKDGSDSGILFSELRQVEKEVVLLEPASPPAANHAHQTSTSAANNSGSLAHAVHTAHNPVGSRVLKVIRKLDVQILCAQHNPAVAAMKKASKQDRIRKDLMALPTMARIKIRVSAGVFEVSLIRVIEETSSVEVLWDRGVKREFKWGSVVFGSTDAPVQQRPSDMALEPERHPIVLPVATYPSVTAATTQSNHASNSSTMPVNQSATVQMTPSQLQQYTNPTPYMYPPRTGPYDYWTYAASQALYTGQAQYPYPYSAYYGIPMAGPTTQNYYNYAQAYSAGQHRNGQLNWQQPYQGPPQPQAAGVMESFPSQGSSQPAQTAPSSGAQAYCTAQAMNMSIPSNVAQPAGGSSTAGPSQTQQGQASGSDSSPAHTPSMTPTPNSFTPEQQSAYKDLATLSTLQPEKIAEILKANPQLRDIVRAAVDQVKRAEA